MSEKGTRVERLNDEIISCQKCGLSKTRKKAVPGEGNVGSRIMFVGQAPGKEEDLQGRPFVGRAGRFLNELLEMIGVERRDVYITSVLKCYPPRNRKPSEDEIRSCLPYLKAQIEIVNPKVVVLLGEVTLKAIIGEGSVKKSHGHIIRRGRRDYFVTYHPAAGMRFPKIKRKMKADFLGLARGKKLGADGPVRLCQRMPL